jgi:hypothetical protein
MLNIKKVQKVNKEEIKNLIEASQVSTLKESKHKSCYVKPELLKKFK